MQPTNDSAEITLTLIERINKSVTLDDKLFDINLKYVINSNTCNGTNNILAVILVTSYFGDVETRSAMRRAFSKEDLEQFNLRRVFMLASAPEDAYTKQNAVINEAQKFDDIIQGNFHEAYRNLTYKHMMGLKWAGKYCAHAKYVIKMDDDIIVNLRKLTTLLLNLKLPKYPIAGYILKNMSPIREPVNKWYVTVNEYDKINYPPFVSGWFYITTPEVCTLLQEHSTKEPYFWIDDVYVTGILIENTKIRQYDLSKIFTVHPEFIECCMTDLIKYKYDCDILVGPNGGDNNLFFKFNEAMKVCWKGNCINRTKTLDDTCVAERKINLGKGNGLIETYRLF